jgi:rod shape-determining protein MreD
MRTLLIGLPVLALAAALEATALADLRVAGGGGVNLVLLFTLAWTLAGDWNGGLLWGLIGGLCLDLLSGGPLGASALVLVIVAFLASLAEGQLWRSHVLLPLAAALMGSVLYHLLLPLILAVFGFEFDWGRALVGVLLPSTLLNLMLIVPLYEILRRVRGWVYPVAVNK